jgi:hypothetical protein
MTTIRGTASVATNCFPTNLPTQPAVDERAQFRDAVATLKNNFGDLKGGFLGMSSTIDLEELYKAVRSPNPQVAAAAKFLMSHPDMLSELDTRAHGGGPDGKISLNDIDTQLASLDRETQLASLRTDPRMMEFAQSMGVIEANWDKLDTMGFWNWNKDGKVSQEDLDKVITDHNAPWELRKAAFFLSNPDNQDLFALMDTAAKGGKTDGVISREDLAAFVQQLQGVAQRMPEPFRAPVSGY